MLTRSVPIFVRVTGDDAAAGDALEALRQRLKAGGYRLVDAEEQSAVKFELDVGEMRAQTMTAGKVKVETAQIAMTLTGAWTFAGGALPVREVEGVGRGRGAAAEAMDSAVAEIVAAIDALAEP